MIPGTINPLVGAGGAGGAFKFEPVLTGNIQNYNLKQQAIAAGWDEKEPLIANITIAAGCYIFSNTTATPAFSTGSTFPDNSTVELVNNGYIMGMGGNGARHDNANSVATAGGNAIELYIAATITNGSGYIFGGGGGGGGGYYGSYSAGGGGGAGGGLGGYSFSAAPVAGGLGGGVGSSGGNGVWDNSIRAGGGGGGRVVGGGAGQGARLNYPGSGNLIGGGGGAGGGGGGSLGDPDPDYGDSGWAGDGGGAGSVGMNYRNAAPDSASAIFGGGGGGWGAAGGAGGVGYGTILSAAAGGKAINLNGHSVSWVSGSGSPNVLGAVS